MTTISILTQTPEIIIGSIFLLTGIAKVLEPWKFIQHISKLRILDFQVITPVSLTFIAIEVALGIALIMNIAPFITIPTSIVSGILFWSRASPEQDDLPGCKNW